MAQTELLARIDACLPPRVLALRKNMFGGAALMVHGHMLIWAGKEGELLVRVGKDGMAEALTRPGASQMQSAGRTMGGFVLVSGDALEDDDALKNWLDTALSVVTALPAKP